MANPLEDVGAYLREERNRLGITLEEISDHTKINLRFLDALERGDRSILPAEAFVRGFIRAYATHVGVDPEEAIQRLNQSTAAEKAREGALAAELRRAQPAKVSSKRLVWIVSLTVIVVVAAVSFAMYRMFKGHPFLPKQDTAITARGPTAEQTEGRDPASRLEVVPPTGDVEEVVVEPALPLRPRSPQLGLKPVGYDKTNAPEGTSAAVEPPSRADALRLSITALDETWVELTIDDGESEDRVKLDPGTTKTWIAREKFVLTLGNIKGTRIALNDRVLSLPFNSGNVLRNYTLTRDMLQ